VPDPGDRAARGPGLNPFNPVILGGAAWLHRAMSFSQQDAASDRQPMDGPLRLVIVLMFVNLGLSVVLTILMLILHNSLLDYELAHSKLPAGASPAEIAVLRNSLAGAMWGRVIGVVAVSALYVWRAFALRRGSRGAYRRLILICIVGLAGIVFLISSAQYPVWMRVEQVLQGIVLLALLFAVTRGPVRDRYARPRAV
jgi:hypothetical protein